ncbi:MAG: T9SS type A sorting domain-containing protein [Bacteroidia bacterium]|nr:T9SS type A sorting domain-containing protein [Bacteroidia bacterium]
MKKSTLLLFAFILALSGKIICQPTVYVEAPVYDNSTSPNRAPNGTSAHANMRAVALVLASELTGITPNTTITAFGFTLNTGTNLNACTGNFTLYLENTNDVTNTKSTTFATAIGGMTSVYANVMTVPTTATSSSITVTLSTPFTYTGGGLYVAYDWNSSGPFDLTAAVYRCNSLGLVNGAMTAASNVSAPTTLVATSFRPCFLFGIANTYTNDIQVIGTEAMGRVASVLSAPQTIKAVIKNASNVAQNNINVGLNITGVNPYTATQTITNLASGAITTVTFNGYNPTLNGLSNLTISVASDQNNNNNQATYSQSVSCNEWGLNPASGSYTNSVGWGTGSGIIACSYSNAGTSTITGMRCAIGTDANTAGNTGWGVLLSSTGGIVATTNTITLTSAMYGTSQEFAFASPQALTAGSTYYLGFAQPANTTAYYPAGALASSYVPQTLYYTTPLTGGVMTPLLQNLGYFKIEAILGHTANVTIASSPTAVCFGACATLSASGTTNYTWSTISSSSTIAVCPTVTTTYSIVGTNSAACNSSAAITLTVNNLPNLTTSSNSTVICLGGTVSLNAGGAVTYSWDTGETTNTVVQTPTITTTYTVTGTNAAGCAIDKTLTIVVNSFTPSISSPSAVCLGEPITLSASGGVPNSYLWGNYPFASITTTPQTTTDYSVTATGPNGCKGSNSVTVLVNPVPTLTVVANRKTMCRGESNTFTVTGATTYSWSVGNFTTSVISVTPNSSVTYSYIATGTDNLGCKDTAMVVIKVNACTGIEKESAENNFEIYPNPNNGIFTMRNASGSAGWMEIYDALGKQIKREPLSVSESNIDISTQSKGVYFLRVITEDRPVKIIRLVKE